MLNNPTFLAIVSSESEIQISLPSLLAKCNTFGYNCNTKLTTPGVTMATKNRVATLRMTEEMYYKFNTLCRARHLKPGNVIRNFVKLFVAKGKTATAWNTLVADHMVLPDLVNTPDELTKARYLSFVLCLQTLSDAELTHPLVGKIAAEVIHLSNADKAMKNRPAPIQQPNKSTQSPANAANPSAAPQQNTSKFYDEGGIEYDED